MKRYRRLRATAGLRRLVSETTVCAHNLIYPVFIDQQADVPQQIQAMPGVVRETVATAVDKAKEAKELGIGALLLFGVTAEKDEPGSAAWDSNGVVQQTIRAIHAAGVEIPIITDVCLCAYTAHGHCGIVDDHQQIDNDRTVELLAKVALSHAQAGCDMVAPSDMMDLRVAGIRSALDGGGYKELPILAYGAKFASAFYGPFRDAARSAPAFGDRRSYQMDPANGREAQQEAVEDLLEGADMLMIKPALPSLDVIARLRSVVDVPLVAYQVSGEYAMIKAAAQAGAFDEQAAVFESLISMRRAGVELIVSYFALEVAKQLQLMR